MMEMMDFKENIINYNFCLTPQWSVEETERNTLSVIPSLSSQTSVSIVAGTSQHMQTAVVYAMDNEFKVDKIKQI
jgi:hypothetical protein